MKIPNLSIEWQSMELMTYKTVIGKMLYIELSKNKTFASVFYFLNICYLTEFGYLEVTFWLTFMRKYVKSVRQSADLPFLFINLNTRWQSDMFEKIKHRWRWCSIEMLTLWDVQKCAFMSLQIHCLNIWNMFPLCILLLNLRVNCRCNLSAKFYI